MTITQPPHGRITLTSELPGYYRAVLALAKSLINHSSS